VVWAGSRSIWFHLLSRIAASPARLWADKKPKREVTGAPLGLTVGVEAGGMRASPEDWISRTARSSQRVMWALRGNPHGPLAVP
jgi:hypothetical protein